MVHGFNGRFRGGSIGGGPIKFHRGQQNVQVHGWSRAVMKIADAGFRKFFPGRVSSLLNTERTSIFLDTRTSKTRKTPRKQTSQSSEMGSEALTSPARSPFFGRTAHGCPWLNLMRCSISTRPPFVSEFGWPPQSQSDCFE